MAGAHWGRGQLCRHSTDGQESSWPCFLSGPGRGDGDGTQMGQSQTYCYPPQAILPLMKFLEVKLCYMNTNLVQENFSRSVAAACPAVSHRFLLSCPSFLASASILGGECSRVLKMLAARVRELRTAQATSPPAELKPAGRSPLALGCIFWGLQLWPP